MPLSYSEGFSPAPRIAYGWPLPVGMSGIGEYVDIELRDRVTPEKAVDDLNRVLPPGLEIREARYVTPHGQSLMADFDTGSYMAHLPSGAFSLEDWRKAAETVLGRQRLEVVREKGGGAAHPGRPAERKVVDIRPLIRRLEPREVTADGRVAIFMELALGDRGAGRPEEVAALLAAEARSGGGNLAGPGEETAARGTLPRPEGLAVVRLGFRRMGGPGGASDWTKP